MKILAYDIDGSMTDTDTFDIKCMDEFCKLKKRHVPINNNFLTDDRLGLSKEDYSEYMNLYFPRLVNRNLPREYSVEILNRLKSDGYKQIVVTARDKNRNHENEPYKGFMMERDTRKWINDNKLPFDDIVFSSCSEGMTKAQVCKSIGASSILEDDPKNINILMQNNIYTLVMDSIRNTKIITTNSGCRVFNMIDYFNTIKKMESSGLL